MVGLQVFRNIGLTEDEDIKRALEVFNEEYAKLIDAQANAAPKDIKSELIQIGLDALIDVLSGSYARAINVSRVWGGLKERFSQQSMSVLDKIGRMISAEGSEDFEYVKDYARIAAHVYGNREDSILPNSWVPLGSKFESLVLDDEKSGLQAALYAKQGEEPEYVYAIAGTRGADFKDWKANLGQVTGISDQYDRAGEIAVKLADELGVENLTMVGHSKGGGQAAYCALNTGCPAITFNPAGLGLYKFNHDPDIEADINSYVMIADPLNLMQLLAQLFYADLTADGSVHYLRNNKTPLTKCHGIDAFMQLGGMTDMHRLMS